MKQRLKTVVNLKTGGSIVLFTEEETEEKLTMEDIKNAIAEGELSDLTGGFDVNGNLVVIPKENINYVTMSFED
ncbi:hypothetical protein PDL16_10140 [Bacillus cereus group sp. BY9-3LC]|uniref:hypothetical protein n=1 Tax=Bacillus cereus group sp. BY9-3LC TaxID=3018075 RepID=UPI0022E4FCA5|nr:hypothetical protein [Bacillus cereus group sp. BY9-3LC]MDA1777464.1 hypothetical protein [Bacillus cereus group sp. BY9-3LC]